MRWRRSSHSSMNGNCVEVAQGHGAVLVRDSKDPRRVLTLSRAAFGALLRQVKGDG